MNKTDALMEYLTETLNNANFTSYMDLLPMIDDSQRDLDTVEYFKEQILKGNHFPILINSNNEVIDGNHRLKAYQDLQIKPPLLYLGERDNFYKVASECNYDALDMVEKMIQNGTATLIECVEQLEESYRDIELQINDLYTDLEDIIYEVDMFPPRDCSDYDFSGEEWEGNEDLKAQAMAIQSKIKELEDKKQQEYNNEIKNLPPKTNKTNFDGFDITKTDPPIDEDFLEGSKYRNYVMNKYGYTDAYIAEMTPEEYLLLCGKYGWNREYDDIETIYRCLGDKDKKDIEDYANRFRNGEKSPLLVLDVLKKSQEGRHRAFACIEAGIKTVPVLIKV